MSQKNLFLPKTNDQPRKPCYVKKNIVKIFEPFEYFEMIEDL